MPNIRFVPMLWFEVLFRQSNLQKTVAVKDKIEVLRLRIAKLEEIFEKPASDEKETKRREGLLTYASGLRFDQMLTPSQQTQRCRSAITVVPREVRASTVRR
jgi:hypothetical protein